MTQLPQGPPRVLRRIQHDFSKDGVDEARQKTLEQRRQAVRNATVKCWRTYQKFAFGRDELMPQSLMGFDSFNGWGATLVDSLDTLWIMGLQEEFRDAVRAVGRIDWNVTEARSCSLFETNIRYLGGLLAAYDLSQDETLLRKASELGEMLYAAFDTP
jgi:mannosyl-oligosaccharide alpha-1,2-mannosidase